MVNASDGGGGVAEENDLARKIGCEESAQIGATATVQQKVILQRERHLIVISAPTRGKTRRSDDMMIVMVVKNDRWSEGTREQSCELRIIHICIVYTSSQKKAGNLKFEKAFSRT